MTKKKADNKKTVKKIPKKKIEPNNKKNFFNIVFFLVGFYLILLGGIYSSLNSLSNTPILEGSEDFIIKVVGVCLLGLGALILVNLLIALSIVFLEIKVHHKKLHSDYEEITKKLRRSVLDAPLAILMSTLSILSIMIIILPIYFKPWLSVLLGISILVLILEVSFGIKTKLVKNMFKSKIYAFLTVVGLLSLIFTVFFVFLYHYASFNIELDKENYFLGEEVHAIIKPKGIFKPTPLNITYSNLILVPTYITDPGYPQAPIYLTINESYLTPHPYNSYIKINYEITSLNPIYRENLNYIYFIPVFNKSTEDFQFNTTF